jgi:hypothetical protein
VNVTAGPAELLIPAAENVRAFPLRSVTLSSRPVIPSIWYFVPSLVVTKNAPP